MAKITKEYQAYLDGLSKALEIVEKGGTAALKEEIAFRGRTQAPRQIKSEAVKDFETRVKISTLDSVTVLVAWNLHKEFGFGKQRLEKFIAAFNNDAECLAGDFVQWEEITAALAEECGIVRSIRWNK